MNRILSRNFYLGSKKINEEAPFGNDIAWGDSIIGRLINSFKRKAQVAYNKKRVDGLKRQLMTIFDEIVLLAGIDLSSNDVKFLEISTLLGELKNQVENEEDVDLLISTTNSVIEAVKSYDFEKKDIMMEALNKFLEFLKNLKKGESKIDSDKDVESELSDGSFYSNSRNLIQSIVDLDADIRNNVVKFDSGKIKSNSFFDLDKFNTILSKIENRHQRDKNYPLTGIILKKFNDGDSSYKLSVVGELIKMAESGLDLANSKKDKKNIDYFVQYLNKYKTYISNIKNPPKEKSKNDPVSKDQVTARDMDATSVRVPERVSESNSNLSPVETHAKNAWGRIVDAHKTSGISKHIEYLSEMLSIGKSNERYKKAEEFINNIGKQILMNISTVGTPISYEDLIKEDHAVSDVSKSISLFIRFILPLREDQGLWASFGIASKHIQSFLDSFKNMEKFSKKEDKSDEDKKDEDKKNEIFNYKSFILIREKNEFSDDIRKEFDTIFTSEISSYFNISEEKKAKLESSAKKRKEFTVTTTDPIIEIVKLFNRAWRLHTPGVIPSGRTGGKVSNSVFMEYEYLGGGSSGTPDSPGGGPYRNKELFDQWNSAVQNVLADTKYRPIFSEDVVFNFNSSETGKEGDPIKKGGKILLKFVNRLLSDTQMYSDKGALPRFLDEYFGLSKEKTSQFNNSDWSYSDTPNDSERNRKSSSKIVREEVKFTSWRPDPKFFEKDNKGSVIRFKTEKDDTTNLWYCKYLFKDKDNKYAYILYSLNGLPFNLTKVIFKDVRPINTVNHVYFGKVRINDVLKKSNWEITNLDVESNMDSGDIKKIEPFITDLSILTNQKGEFFKGIGKLFGKQEYKRITTDYLKKNIDKLK